MLKLPRLNGINRRANQSRAGLDAAQVVRGEFENSDMKTSQVLLIADVLVRCNEKSELPSARRSSSFLLTPPTLPVFLISLVIAAAALLVHYAGVSIPVLSKGHAFDVLALAYVVSQMPVFVRLTRGQVLSVKHEEYVEAAHAVGNSARRIVLRHILPNIIPPLLVQATLATAAAIIAEASLSFLGLGQQPPDPSWGSMLNSAKNFMSQAPWMAIWPGLAIFSLVMSLNLLGDGVRDALDPRGDS